MQSHVLHIFFDVNTGFDYPDGDEWFIGELFFMYEIKIPDTMKGYSYFTTINGDGKNFWYYHELIRYKY